MKQRAIDLLIVCAIAVVIAGPAAAQDRNDGKDKGVYTEVALDDKDYHLIETSEEMYHQFQRRGMRYRDAELEGWLQSIGESLHPEPTDFYQDYRFFLIRDPSANAFALPDGQIYVHTGLIARLENEAELASLLAHEINHVAGHHGILGYRSQKKKAVASIFIGIAGAAAGGWGDVAGALIQVGLMSSIFGYSQDLEREADMNAFDLLLKADYDVREMPRLYEVLGEDYEGLQPRIKGKWTTHPDLASRGAYMTEIVSQLPEEQYLGLRKGEEGFREKVRPLALHAVEDYILDNYPKTAVELARRLVEEDDSDPWGWTALGTAYLALGFLSEFDEGEALTDKQKRAEVKRRLKLTREELEAEARRSPTARANLMRNLAEAEKAFQAALERDANAADAYKGLGDTYLEDGRYRQAGLAYVSYLKMKPDAPDREVVMARVREAADKMKAENGE